MGDRIRFMGFELKWVDAWIGVYLGERYSYLSGVWRRIYICPLPFLCFKLEFFEPYWFFNPVSGEIERRLWRRCPNCGGVCHWHDTMWVCDQNAKGDTSLGNAEFDWEGEGCGAEWDVLGVFSTEWKGPMIDQIKVPEAVLEAYINAHAQAFNYMPHPTSRGMREIALAAALTQFCEELLGEEAMNAAVQAIMGEQQKRPLEQVAVQAAIDSVIS